MKKENKGGIILVILGFILGYIIRLIAMRYLPGLLPDTYKSASNLIALSIQILISGGVIFGVIRIPHIIKEKKSRKKAMS